MRTERSINTVSWIPSDLLEGMGRLATRFGLAHHDPPPPESLGADTSVAIAELLRTDRLRFANELRAYIDVADDGSIGDYGYCGGGSIGATTIDLGLGSVTVPATKLPDIQAAPEVSATCVRFRQTVGGRTGAPMPRTLARPPFVQFFAPIVWTTLELTIHVDGTHSGTVSGASGFPRHWVFDDDGNLSGKSGMADYKAWMSRSFGRRTPWGDEDSPAFMAEVESSFERDLHDAVMRGSDTPRIKRVKQGRTLVEQGDLSREIYLVLNGVLLVEVDGEPIAEVGPGAVLGERASIDSGARTATLRALTDCNLAEVRPDGMDQEKLQALSTIHRREVDR